MRDSPKRDSRDEARRRRASEDADDDPKSAKSEYTIAANCESLLHASTMLPLHAVSPDVRFSSDFTAQGQATCQGSASYTQSAARWYADAVELLRDYQVELLRCTPTGPRHVSVRWRASWTPDSLVWLSASAQLLGLRVHRFTILDRAFDVAQFSWVAVARLFSRVLQGELQLPVAAVEARADLSFDDDGLCVLHAESIDQVADADSGRLRNRRVAADTAIFLDVCRRPEGVEPSDWESAVRSRVLSSVPGTGPLDIDDSAEGSAPAVFALLSVVVVIVGSMLVFPALFGAPQGTEFSYMPAEEW